MKLCLRDLEERDIEWLFRIYTDEALSFRWHLAGELPTFSEFVRNGNPLDGFYRSFVIDESGKAIGVAFVGPADEADGTASFGICLDPSELNMGKGVTATVLLCKYLFEDLQFRKIYTQSVEFNINSFFGKLSKYVNVEGCFRRHHFFAGKYWDVTVLSLFRDEWNTMQSTRIISRILGSGTLRG